MKYQDFISREYDRILENSEVDRREIELFIESMVSDRPLIIDEVEAFLEEKFSGDPYMVDIIRDVVLEVKEEEEFDNTADKWERRLGNPNMGSQKHHGDEEVYRYGGI